MYVLRTSNVCERRKCQDGGRHTIKRPFENTELSACVIRLTLTLEYVYIKDVLNMLNQ